jgi:hypothetical protein
MTYAWRLAACTRRLFARMPGRTCSPTRSTRPPGAIRRFVIRPSVPRSRHRARASVVCGVGPVGDVASWARWVSAVAGSGGWALWPAVADRRWHQTMSWNAPPHGRPRWALLPVPVHPAALGFHPPGQRSAPGSTGSPAARMTGPYEPLNGSRPRGPEPAAAPDQAYAWWVLPDLRVMSFLKLPVGRRGRPAAGRGRRRAGALRWDRCPGAPPCRRRSGDPAVPVAGWQRAIAATPRHAGLLGEGYRSGSAESEARHGDGSAQARGGRSLKIPYRLAHEELPGVVHREGPARNW